MRKIGFLFAMALTLVACSDSNESSNTYYYSSFGTKNCLELESAISAFIADKPETLSFSEVKDLWSKIIRLNNSEFIESGTGLTETRIKDVLVQSDVTPKEADEIIKYLNTKGNIIAQFIAIGRYCQILYYVEKE